MADRALEGRAFRQALGQFPTGVCVVTCAVDGALLGMTMSSFNSLSLEPPLVLFSIDRRAASLPLWQKAERYAVHVLAENQRGVSDRFARPLSNKWEGVNFMPSACGVPILSSPQYSSALAGRATKPAITFCSSPRSRPSDHRATGSRSSSAKADTPRCDRPSLSRHFGRSTSTTEAEE